MDVRGNGIYGEDYKSCFEAIIKEIIFIDDALYTIMTEQSIVNSRTLAKFSDNIDDYEALTPNHFMLGQ